MSYKLNDLKSEKYVAKIHPEELAKIIADLVDMLRADPHNNNIKEALKVTIKQGCKDDGSDWEKEYAQILKDVSDTIPLWKRYVWIKGSLDYVGIALSNVVQIISYSGGILTGVMMQASRSFHEGIRDQGIKSREAREKKKGDGSNG